MAKKVYIDFELKYKEAVKNLDEMQSEYSKLEKEVKKTSESQEELGGILDSTTGGAVTKFKSLKGTLGTVIKSFKSLRVAILATGIGALILAVGSLAAMFSRSEEGQNKFAKILTQIGVVAGNVMDILSDLGKVVFNVFTGNFKAAGDALSDVTEGIKNFGEETRNEIKVAGELADKRAKADKLERQLLIDRAEATRKFNELRERAADKENVEVNERIRLLKEAGAIEEAITIKEIAAARLRFEAKKAQNELSESTKEDLDEQAQLEARLIELEASRLKKQKTLTAEITTNLREAAAERKALEAEEKARIAEEEKLAKEKQDAEDKAELDRLKLLAEEKKKIREKELEDEKAVEAAKLQVKNAAAQSLMSGFRLLASTDKKNKKLQAAMLIATNAVGIATNIINTMAANARLVKDAGAGAGALILANKIRMITGIATSIAATKQGLSALKESGNSNSVTARGAGGGEIGSQAPAFNIVGASASNQLAESIAGQQQQPIQAYVVSNDVSTAQELDRNIITGASIG